MTLKEKLNTINVPRFTPLQDGKALTAGEFWDSFIVHNLPAKDVALKWHRVLIEYVKRPEAMFAIRYYNTAVKDKYDSLHRGFLTRTNEGYSFFYTDNFHAAYYLNYLNGQNIPLSRIVQKYFDGGKRNDWKKHADRTGLFFLRNYEVHPDARKFLVAEFLVSSSCLQHHSYRFKVRAKLR